jgi:hypothetical protein
VYEIGQCVIGVYKERQYEIGQQETGSANSCGTRSGSAEWAVRDRRWSSGCTRSAVRVRAVQVRAVRDRVVRDRQCEFGRARWAVGGRGVQDRRCEIGRCKLVRYEIG